MRTSAKNESEIFILHGSQAAKISQFHMRSSVEFFVRNINCMLDRYDDMTWRYQISLPMVIVYFLTIGNKDHQPPSSWNSPPSDGTQDNLIPAKVEANLGLFIPPLWRMEIRSTLLEAETNIYIGIHTVNFNNAVDVFVILLSKQMYTKKQNINCAAVEGRGKP